MIEFHPVANIFPLIRGKEFDELVADIEQHGLREPITLHEDGRILDGRNRYMACEYAGVDARLETYHGPDPVAFVVSLNLRRRHLNESQRAMVAASIAKLGEGRPSITAPAGAVSQDAAANMLNVARRTVQRASVVRDHAAPELAAKVTEGKVSVSAAADVATLPVEEQQEIIARGEKEILEAAKRIRAARGEVRREERIEKLTLIAKANAPLNRTERYPVIYADPPWRYEHVETESRAIENQYPTMSLDEICALPVSNMATDDAILFLWATAPKLEEALRVVKDWGFVYRSCAIWDKQKIGMGYYFRIQHEILLIATRGSMPTPEPADRVSSVVSIPRGSHSSKPDEFRKILERFYPTLPRIELFCRGPAEGWDVWGNQSAKAA